MAIKNSKKVKQTWALFIVTFLVSLIIITYFIKSFSPNVDVEIGGEEEQTIEESSSDSDVKKAIDDRLRWIQMEDNMPGASKRDENANEDITYMDTEKNKDQENKTQENADQKTQQNEMAPIEYVNQKHQIQQPPVPKQTATPQAEPFKMSKVYVGSYPTIEQAIQAQNKLMNSPISVSPFVKEVNGSYVLQAGSYANAGKAESVAREINSVGFSARVVKE